MERRMSPRRLTTAPLNCESPRSRPINMAAFRGDAEQDRRLAAARSSAADLFDQTVVDETADEVADGGPRQAGQSGKVGARQRAVVVKGPQHQLLIERSRLVVRGLLWQHRRGVAHTRANAPPTGPPCLLPCGSAGLTKSMLSQRPDFVKTLDKEPVGVASKKMATPNTAPGWSTGQMPGALSRQSTRRRRRIGRPARRRHSPRSG